MSIRATSANTWLWLSVASVALGLGPATAAASDLKFEAQLIWGTNDTPPSDPKYKPVDAEVRKKLKELPLKWNNYFEIKRLNIVVPRSGSQRVALSEKCELELKDLGHSKVEITHYGKGQPVYDGMHALPKGEIFVLGGNAPNATTWLVILKRVD
jgi:hypothetical protein